MITASAQMTDFIKQKVQTPIAYALVQLPTSDGKYAASQIMLANILSYRITRTADIASDTCELTFTDDSAQLLSINRAGKYAALFQPGPIDTKFLVYTGFKGQNYIGTAQFNPFGQALVQRFTGFVETDATDNQPFSLNKTVTLTDLTKQFRFQVNDTLPHPLYGDQTLAYFDPTYNLTNPSGDGKTWVCDGKMFTQGNSDKQWGSTHIDPAVYVDTTGGLSPSNTPVSNGSLTIVNNVWTGTAYTFDYHNGTVTFNTAISTNSAVSLAGNPTYMAPEVMIRKMLVEKANWSPNFLNLDTSGVLLPQFVADSKTLWDCMKLIAGMTAPRYVPWVVWADENGTVKFYESRVDSPAVKTYLRGENVFDAQIEFTARQLQTVVRADASVYTTDGTNSGEQPITAIAYDVDNVNRYGLTEPLVISTDITQAVRHMNGTQAISNLSMLCAATLAQVSRPSLTIKATVRYDPTIQISDKIHYKDDRYGIDRSFFVNGMEETGSAQDIKQILDLTEFYDSINYTLGLPAGVSGDGSGQTSTVAAPSTALFGAIHLGSNLGMYAMRDGQYVRDSGTGDAIIPVWNVADSGSSGMNFDIFLNPLPALPAPGAAPPSQPFGYTNLPIGYNWTPITENGLLVYTGTAPASPQTPLAAGDLVKVGPDSIFYYSHAGGAYTVWVPTGNATPDYLGGPPTYTGATSTVYVWSWWYLCLDGNGGVGKTFRPVMRVNPSQDGVAQTVGATTGLWLRNLWTGPPGPSSTAGVTKAYSNVVIGVSDYTTPAPGFVGANVMGDGTNIGVAYGSDLTASTYYVNYQKKTRGHFCVFACNSTGARQFARVPFDLML